MLADDVLSSTTIAGMAGDKTVDLDQYMHESHRFDLSPEFVGAARDVAWSQGPAALLRVLGVCRLPYETTWIEFPHSSRTPREVVGPGSVKRVGMLLQARNNDFSSFDAHLFWSYRNLAMTSGLSMIVDLGSGEITRSIRQSQPSTGDSSADLESRFVPYRSPFSRSVTDMLQSRGVTADQYKWEALKDWAGECTFLVAVLALLNSKVDKVVSPPRFAKSPRRGNAARKPLLSYHICEIDRVLRTQSATSRDADKTRAHFVRGHFKTRASGIFWWTPYIRGETSLGFVSKSYLAGNAGTR